MQEIRGSHYFVTGLSVVGGIYLFGLAGCLIGPMCLVALIISSRVYVSVVQTDSCTTPKRTQLVS